MRQQTTSRPLLFWVDIFVGSFEHHIYNINNSTRRRRTPRAYFNAVSRYLMEGEQLPDVSAVQSPDALQGTREANIANAYGVEVQKPKSKPKKRKIKRNGRASMPAHGTRSLFGPNQVRSRMRCTAPALCHSRLGLPQGLSQYIKGSA